MPPQQLQMLVTLARQNPQLLMQLGVDPQTIVDELAYLQKVFMPLRTVDSSLLDWCINVVLCCITGQGYR